MATRTPISQSSDKVLVLKDEDRDKYTKMKAELEELKRAEKAENNSLTKHMQAKEKEIDSFATTWAKQQHLHSSAPERWANFAFPQQEPDAHQSFHINIDSCFE